MIKYYKVPDWHDVYALYENYLKNQRKSVKIVLQFMRKYNLHSSLIQIGESYKKSIRKGVQGLDVCPYFKFKDNDPKVLEHDLKILRGRHSDNATTYKKPDKNGFYELRKNSNYIKEWKTILAKNDNFKILDEPSIKEYIILSNKDGEDKGIYLKKFKKIGDNLYLRLEYDEKFIVSEEFIEIPKEKGMIYFNDNEGDKSKLKIMKGVKDYGREIIN